jgi:hypothetical protein
LFRIILVSKIGDGGGDSLDSGAVMHPKMVKWYSVVYGEQNLLLSCANLPYIFVDFPKINLHYELEICTTYVRIFVSKIKINLKGLSTVQPE